MPQNTSEGERVSVRFLMWNDLESGAALEEVQLALGHLKISTTQKYTKPSKKRFDRVNEAKRRLWDNGRKLEEGKDAASDELLKEVAALPAEKLQLFLQLV